MPEATVKPTLRVLSQSQAFPRLFFAFTPLCSQNCADDQFGVKSLSSGQGFLPQDDVSKSSLPQAIVSSVGSILEEYEVDRYMNYVYDDTELHTTILQAAMPINRVFIFCPPCVQTMTTAVSICINQNGMLSEWRVRVDHRLGCKCCPDTASALARIEMIADTIADVKSGNHWAKILSAETSWMEYMDHGWLEQILYNEETENASNGLSNAPLSMETSSPTDTKLDTSAAHDDAGIRRMLTFDGMARSKAGAVILADVDHAGWIIDSPPFPAGTRPARTGDMYFMKSTVTGVAHRSFVGSFSVKDALKRRRNESPPPVSSENKRQLRSRK